MSQCKSAWAPARASVWVPVFLCVVVSAFVLVPAADAANLPAAPDPAPPAAGPTVTNHPIPAAFPLPNGEWANQLRYDDVNEVVYFIPSDPADSYKVQLPEAVHSWAWSTVPGILGWTELVLRLDNDNMVGINPDIPFFPMRGESYNDGLTAIAAEYEPRIRSTLGGTVKGAVYQFQGGGGRIILAGNANNYLGPYDVGTIFSLAPGGNPSNGKLPEGGDPAPGKRAELENVMATRTFSASDIPASSTVSLSILAVLILSTGAITALRRG